MPDPIARASLFSFYCSFVPFARVCSLPIKSASSKEFSVVRNAPSFFVVANVAKGVFDTPEI